MFQKFEGVIWDWNGTLLDDTEMAVQVMNKILDRRNIPQLSIDRYKEVFTFPVRDYYQKIGFDFDKEPFEIPASEFILHYNDLVNNCQLHKDSIQVLTYFKQLELPQFILSAMQQETLNQCLDRYQITNFFEFISGLGDHYAGSKIENGHRLISGLNLNPQKILLIGDTCHDFEVAEALGCSCVLVTNGHQSRSVLETTKANLINNLSELLSQN